MEPKMEFTIKRSQWLRGEGHNSSMLLRSDNKMCCLGFFALACGIPKEDMLDVQSPAGVVISSASFADFSFLISGCLNSRIAYQLMDHNDSTAITDVERENAIRTIFAEQGIKVNFID